MIWCEECLVKYEVKQLLNYQLLISSARFRIYCRLRSHYIVQEGRPLVPVLSMKNPSQCRSFKWPLCFRVLHKNPECIALLLYVGLLHILLPLI